MASKTTSEHVSPWREVFENVRKTVGHQRDVHGVLGSINWLRKEMARRGANPNVVRNIIYRDKGKLADKRVLFEILSELWTASGQPPLRAPELEVLLSPGSSAEQEVLQLLGREKRRAYRAFVGGVRSGETPRMLVTGRPGSGKTLLADYIQHALEMAPRAADRVVRLEFASSDLAGALTRMALALGVPPDLVEGRLLRIGSSSAFAVQADAQAEIARIIIDAARQHGGRLAFLVHVSQSLTGQQDSLGMVPLRLNTPEVPRVSASEWLWLSLFEPLGRLPGTAVLASMADVPARAMQRLGAFEGPVKLTPPTTAEARRFVRARLPRLSASQQEDIVQRAGRSFEELRTLTLLAEVREPHAEEALGGSDLSIEQLGKLVDASGDARLRDFLAALAVLSIPEFPTFEAPRLVALRRDGAGELNTFELAFLDQVPGAADRYRCFSRQLARALRQRLIESDAARYRSLNSAAAAGYSETAFADPAGEAASRFLHHVFEAREWDTMTDWLSHHSIQQSLVRRIWAAAESELVGSPMFHAVAKQVAAHYVKLGSYDHVDARSAFDALARSEDDDTRAWTVVKRAEGEVLKGRYEPAERLLDGRPDTGVPLLRAETALVRASIARWRSDLDAAAELVDDARNELANVADDDSETSLARAKVLVWAGLIAKDRGDLEGALERFAGVTADDDLIRARIAFQRGDVRLKLGRFDQALRDLDRSVTLGASSEALEQEQTRFLSRRGTLHRRMGDLAAARADFDTARSILEAAQAAPVERDFWLAKVDDEAALALLAEGAFEEATFTLARSIDRFRAYAAALEVDAEYRVLRTTLHMGLAYACRGLARPYKLPLPVLQLPEADVPDLRHARERIGEVLDSLEGKPDRELYGVLVHEAHLLAALVAADPADALRHAERALEASRFEYQRAEALASATAAHLRMDDAPSATAALDEGEKALRRALSGNGVAERGNLGLRAQYVALGSAAQLQLGASAEAAERLALALEDGDLAAYHEGLLRAFGEGAERITGPDGAWRSHARLGALLGLQDRPDVGPARLPDALVARWRNRRHTIAT